MPQLSRISGKYWGMTQGRRGELLINGKELLKSGKELLISGKELLGDAVVTASGS